MIIGAHAILYSTDADGTRGFLRDVLGLPSVDAGGGWLIFGLPPAEVAVHPAEGDSQHELYLMCDDIETTVADLRSKGAEVSRPVTDQGWGLLTSLRLPGGVDLGLYQPRHPTALSRPL
jgi:predicted enzyme related to lactoylglutathione lyase